MSARRFSGLLNRHFFAVTIAKPSISMNTRENAWREIREALASVRDIAPDASQSPQEQEKEIARWVKAARLEHARRLPHNRPSE
jgi:uncharacterized protein YaaN involved in tellurite resistance